MKKESKSNGVIKRIKFMLNTEGHSSKTIEFGFLALSLSELTKLPSTPEINSIKIAGSLICLILMIYHFILSGYKMIKNYILQKSWPKNK